MRVTTIASFSLLVTLGSCDSRHDAHRMRDAAEQLSHVSDSTGILFIDPGECVACNNMISDWMHWGDEGDARSLVIVFTRSPSPEEAKWLRTARVSADTVLTHGSLHNILGDPLIYFAAHGTIVDSAKGQTGLHLLLSRLDHSSAK